MNIWFRRLLVVLTVGGGYLGVVTTSNAFFTGKEMAMAGYAIISFFVLLHIYGIFAGIRLSEDPSRYGHVLFFYALQVPFFSSPFILYRFSCGLQASIGVVGFSFGWMFRFGSDWEFALLQPNPWGFGVNLVAAIIFFALFIHFLQTNEKLPEDNLPVADAPPRYDY